MTPFAAGYHCGMPPRRRAALAWTFVALTTLVSAGLLAAAMLVPAPAAVLPLVIAACVGCPMVAAYELARTLTAVRDPELQLRRELERLPETPHPLGL